MNDYRFEWDVDLAGKLKPGDNSLVLRISTDWKRRLNNSCRRSESRVLSSSSVKVRSSDALVKELSLSLHDLGLD